MTVGRTPAGVDDAERLLFQRVLDALLREDHLGLWHNGRTDGPGQWLTRTPAVRLRIPVRPDGFQHPLRCAGPELTVLAETGAPRPVRTLDGLLDLLAPTDDPEAEAGWADFRAECRADLAARRLAARTAPRVYAERRAARRTEPDGMAGALWDDALAARTDHPVYPTGRCRHGLDERDLLRYAPEHAPTFVLRWTPVPVSELTVTGRLPAWWPAAPSPETGLLPVHPLTAARYDLPVVDDVPDVPVRPTLSMRTVAVVDDPALRLKLPLPTATLGARNLRTISPGTLADGAALHRLLDRIAAAEPAFADRILHADESCHGQAGADARRAFLLRRFPGGLAGCRVVPVSALAAADPDGGTVAQRVGGPDPRPLLDAYLDLLLDWHGYLWLRHGIALEAHQQNIHCVLDPADRDGASLRLLYQDNDGARLAPRPGVDLADTRMWITDRGELADVFTTITLHLAATAPLRDLAGHGVPVPSPGAALRPRLVRVRDRWTAGVDTPTGLDGWDVAAAARMLTERVLDANRLPVKAMVTAGTLLPKSRTGCADVNKYYRRTGPNYLRPDR
ncbi:IucA/IucC family protein [Plantactinospora sp. B5E13]|uniref:IucA/IucC family protein n=1 Tax=Plantactinospora sp. B5E13 TaxID=3153758 RepID=UPI00325DA151